jgi:N-methylhydantoinase B
VTVTGGDEWIVGPGLRVTATAGEDVLACDECGTVMAPLTGNWKDGALVGVVELPDANRLCPPPGRFIDEDFVLRQYACPGCARLMDSEVQRRDDSPTWDFRIEGRV